MTVTISELMLDRMPKAFLPDQAQGVTANVQFDFSQDGGGLYVVSIVEGQCSVCEGQIDQPDASIITSQATYLDVAEGRANVMTAFMTGKLRAAGNLPLLMRFQQIFGPLLAE
jgi:putative sterol carrier protein